MYFFFLNTSDGVWQVGNTNKVKLRNREKKQLNESGKAERRRERGKKKIKNCVTSSP